MCVSVFHAGLNKCRANITILQLMSYLFEWERHDLIDIRSLINEIIPVNLTLDNTIY